MNVIYILACHSPFKIVHEPSFIPHGRRFKLVEVKAEKISICGKSSVKLKSLERRVQTVSTISRQFVSQQCHFQFQSSEKTQLRYYCEQVNAKYEKTLIPLLSLTHCNTSLKISYCELYFNKNSI